MNGSVRLTPFSLCSHHCIIMNFLGVITNHRSEVHTKGQGQRSKVNVTEVTIQLSHFQTVTQVWIHMWWWYDAQHLMMLRRGALLFPKVICQISRSHRTKKSQILSLIECFRTQEGLMNLIRTMRTPGWILNLPMAFKWCTKLDIV